MNIIETIRAHIDQQYEGNREKARYDDYYRGMNDGLDKLEQFLDTIPEQNPPKWKIADKPIFGAMYIIRKVYGALVEHTVAQYVCEGEEYIIVRELEKLQKEK